MFSQTDCQSVRASHRRRGFTLIELLVVIAIIALLVGILLPALGSARENGRRAVCLNNSRQMVLSMTLYAANFKDFYPVKPKSSSSASVWNSQQAQGGLAGYFSLNQVGDGVDMGAGAVIPTTYGDLNSVPLMQSFLEAWEQLTCPSDRLDYYFTGASTNLNAGTKSKTPKKPGKEQDVISYNISYLYIAGLKTDEPGLVAPVPVFGDESLAYDVGSNAWYGSAADAAFAGTKVNFWSKQDNHGSDGANYAYTDGHAVFVKGNAAATFFSGGSTNPQNINVTDGSRSSRIQTVD